MTRAREAVLVKTQKISGAHLDHNKRTRVPEIRTSPRGLEKENLGGDSLAPHCGEYSVPGQGFQAYSTRLYCVVVKVQSEKKSSNPGIATNWL